MNFKRQCFLYTSISSYTLFYILSLNRLPKHIAKVTLYKSTKCKLTTVLSLHPLIKKHYLYIIEFKIG